MTRSARDLPRPESITSTGEHTVWGAVGPHALVFRARDPRARAAVVHWIRPAGSATVGEERPVALDLEVRTGRALPAPERSPSLHLVGADLALYRDATMLDARAGDGEAHVRVDLDTGRGVATVTSRGSEASAGGSLRRCLKVVISLVLARHGLHGMHAATVVVADRTVVVLGDRGAGKSTLVGRLLDRGHGFVSDDLSFVDEVGYVTGVPDRPALTAEGIGKRPVEPGVVHDGTPRRAGLVLWVGGATDGSPTRPGGAAVLQYLLQTGNVALDEARDPRRLRALAALVGAVPVVALPHRPSLPDDETLLGWMDPT